MTPQIVNIINFIRLTDPRAPERDLVEPVRRQIGLLKANGLPSTFLIEYDAMNSEEIVGLLKNDLPEHTEIGLWLEIVQPMCEDAGLPWRSERGYSWDWYANVGFSVGYTPDERKLLADQAVRKFRETFGYAPKSVGSWMIDCVTLRYLYEQYGIAASCNCRDQWGTDGYTIWGGFYMGGYYPSVSNVLCPAKTTEDAIGVPLFRMLGSDPIYQYDLGLRLDEKPADLQQVMTLEPVSDGGGDPRWVDWFFQNTYNGVCCSHAYCQAGQENSFGWAAMAAGLEYQFPQIARLRADGKVTVQTLAESGEWYKNTHRVTAPAASFADGDASGRDRRSLWYCCRNYRVNLYGEDGRFWLRDLCKFDSRYPERYLNARCETPVLHYDNLPVVDGNRASGHGVRAGLFPLIDGQPVTYRAIRAESTETSVTARISAEPCDFVFFADETGFRFTAGRPFTLRFAYDPQSPQAPQWRTSGERLVFTHNGYEYSILVTTGAVTKRDGVLELHSLQNRVSVKLF